MARPMADWCLVSGAHYLDITGEIDVFEALFARDAEAKRAGVTLMPGVGFDVAQAIASPRTSSAGFPTRPI